MKKTAALACALMLILTACGTEQGNESTSSSSAHTTINGSGASSQAKAQQAWRDSFRAQKPDITVNYEATGSGTGREQFLAGQVAFAGSDKALSSEEIEKASATCGGGIVELPAYISPIAVAYNLPEVKNLKLSADLLAQIFSGEITSWDDKAIASENPSAKLPSTKIIPVNRADKSGTTENFTEYLSQASSRWGYDPSEVWPIDGTQSAEKTSGVIQLASSVEGAITYADAAQIGQLQAAQISVAGKFVGPSPEAAAAIVDGSPESDGSSDTVLTVDLKRDGSVEGAYPIVMVSYLMACHTYDDSSTAQAVKDFMSFIVSSEGQKAAAEAGAGNAPLSNALRAKADAAIATME